MDLQQNLPLIIIAVIVVALIAGVAIWFAVASRLTSKPWENSGPKGDVGAIGISPARIGLWVFMAVVTSLFALFLSAYSMRMHHAVGWCHLTLPRVVWLNTAVLAGASVTMRRQPSVRASTCSVSASSGVRSQEGRCAPRRRSLM